ncbi:MAG: hypothetical protein ACR2OU_21820 [Thermomicrobiales bacterium]
MTDDPRETPESASPSPADLSPPNTSAPPGAPNTPGKDDGEDVGRVKRGRFASDENGSRPFSLYAVLGLGVGALLVLLAIIYFSSMDRSNPEQPICTAIGPEAAQQAVMNGEVKRIVVNYDKSVDDPTDPKWGPVLSRIDYFDGGCGNLPQGIQARDATTLVLGTVLLYNETTNQPQVELKLVGSGNLNPSLFVTPTLEPTMTPVPTMTPEVTPTQEPTATVATTPTAVPSVEAAATPAATSITHVATTASSPATSQASPVASPEPTRKATPEASETSPGVERIPTPTVTPVKTKTPRS